MKKWTLVVAILSLALLSSMIATAFAAPPTIKRPLGLIEETIEGGSIATVDYSVCYDTASAEIIQNMMDTLIMFNGEHTDQFIPSVAASWSQKILGTGTGIDSGLPISGLTLENPDSQPGPNARYYYQYDFKIRQGIFFQPPYNYSLTTDDVGFSFQRTLIMDTTGGPQWMFQEPLLDFNSGQMSAIADMTNMTQVGELGALIKNCVQWNSTDVWFNLMFPGAYAPFMQILTQQWAAIESKQWINNQVRTADGGARAPYEWDGNWPDTTSWLAYWNPPTSNLPLDNPSFIMYGSGPYIITTLDPTNSFWAGVRYQSYFMGWPAAFPLLSASKPAGWADTIYVTWANAWAARLSDFTAGDCDFCAVPRQYLSAVYKGASPYQTPPNYPLDGLRTIQPIPQLAVDAFFFQMNINPATIYGPITAAGIFQETSIPSDFFGNPVWGKQLRQGFAQAFDYATFLTTAYLGEAMHPATALIPGLVDYDPSVAGWSYNLAAATTAINNAGLDANGKTLGQVGFTLTLSWNLGNLPRQTACTLLANALNGMNPKFHVTSVGVAWADYLHARNTGGLPMYSMGWLADFPDPHDFVLPFYHTGGNFAGLQGYSNPTMDSLIDQAILTPEGSARAALYKQVEQLAVTECPSFTLDQAIGRHFERDWVNGYYVNPVYPAEYFYNLWKWYYAPVSALSATSNPPPATSTPGFNLPADVNYDGKVDMKDIGIVAKAFGTSYGPPPDPRWVYRGDVNNDRKIDMKDIGYVAKQFGKSGNPWPLINTVISGPSSTLHGVAVTYTDTVTGMNATYPSYSVTNFDWQIAQWPGILVSVQSGASNTLTYTFPSPGIYYIELDVFYTIHLYFGGDWTTSIAEFYTITVT